MRIAYFSPLPPQPSGIADYSAGLLPYLARLAEIDLFVDPAALGRDHPLSARFTCHPYRQFDDPAVRAGYDRIVYQLGNSRLHDDIYRGARRYPGVVVLHELVLHHLVAEVTLHRGCPDEYQNALAETYGEAGRESARAVIEQGKPPDFFRFPLSEPAIHSALGVIVHSRYLAERVRLIRPDVPVARIPMFSFSLTDGPGARGDAVRGRQRLGLHPDQLLVGSFGFVVPTKRIDVCLHAFRSFHRRHPDSRYAIVGSVSSEVELDKLIRELGLTDSVIVTESLPESDFMDILAATDLCLNLRYPTGGETSAALIRMLGLGKAVIVSRTGTFVELPDSICRKITPGTDEVDELTGCLERLALDLPERRRLERNALDWIQRSHRPEDAARGYVDFLQALPADPGPIVSSSAGLYLDQIADALLDLGIADLDGALLGQLAVPAADLSRAGPPANPR